MFNKKLNSKDLVEVSKRMELINEHRLVVEALIMQKNIFLRQILPKYGCDMNKQYDLDFATGRIKETKEEKKK